MSTKPFLTVSPVRLSVPDWNLEYVSSTVPFHTESNNKPVVRTSEKPIPLEATQKEHYNVCDGIVELLDAAKQTSGQDATLRESCRLNYIQAPCKDRPYLP